MPIGNDQLSANRCATIAEATTEDVGASAVVTNDATVGATRIGIAGGVATNATVPLIAFCAARSIAFVTRSNPCCATSNASSPRCNKPTRNAS